VRRNCAVAWSGPVDRTCHGLWQAYPCRLEPVAGSVMGNWYSTPSQLNRAPAIRFGHGNRIGDPLRVGLPSGNRSGAWCM